MALSAAQLSDRSEIRDVLMQHCRGVDRLDWELIRGCFWDDARIRYEPIVDGDTDVYMAFLRRPDALGGLTRTMHFAGTLIIELDGDIADTELYAKAHHTSTDEHPYAGAFVTTYLRYVDRLERRAGEWRIARRHVVREWMRRDTAGMWEDVPAPGRRDRTDPIYVRGDATAGSPDQI
jgi:hypothetical protein